MINKSLFLLVFGLILSLPNFADTIIDTANLVQPQTEVVDTILDKAVVVNEAITEKVDDHHASTPALWSVIPFATLLLLIATGPLFFHKFWHHHYPKIAIALGLITLVYYLFGLHDTHAPLHALQEYVSFITLIAALFVASGGIVIKADRAGTPLTNIALLVFGAFIANIIGTTGASMLLIRPFVRLNKDRVQPYHIVFFIFMVSNVGGCLTPIGDPPLFLGFLKGVDFFWTAKVLWPQWILGISLLALIFFFIDRKNYKADETATYTGKVEFKGIGNLVFLAIAIGAVFVDPNVLTGLPTLILSHGHLYFSSIDGYVAAHGALTKHDIIFSFWRELMMLGVAVFAYKMANEENLRDNEFNFEPIREVGFIFIGIFATMMPALKLIELFAGSPEGSALINTHSLYWATGLLSGVLDNAPTYLNFLSAGMGSVGLEISNAADVKAFMNGDVKLVTIDMLKAISIGAVFFGAFTYIGNAPNFMVKSIAEQIGIKMPSFVSYIFKYSIPILLPVLFITWLVFFYLGVG